jgi:hypothetical protein
MSETTKRPAEWGVVDMNAYALKPGTDEIMPRAHEVAPGKRYHLFSDRETFMPEAHARLFLKDPSFIVRDPEGDVRKALTEEQQSRVAPAARLAANFVIADLTELTDNALRDRVMVHPRASDLPKNPDRATMTDFLLGLYEAAAAPGRGNDDAVREIEGNLEASSDPVADAARIFGDG